jgi:hypothetical protein
MPRPAKSGIGGVKGHNMDEISFSGSPALMWAGSFIFPLKKQYRNPSCKAKIRFQMWNAHADGDRGSAKEALERNIPTNKFKRLFPDNNDGIGTITDFQISKDPQF